MQRTRSVPQKELQASKAQLIDSEGSRRERGRGKGVSTHVQSVTAPETLSRQTHISRPLPLLDMIYVTNTRQQKIENIYLIFTFVTHI